ncbi:hypothetical protein QR98_0104170 [Sarcoptes scabiei]|uniref:Protein quiver n=1 Tax=Sarcoptes scabiei TaxID=52283 RepID=A0A132ALK2_SARSC|nr:hypothetical protein QR98_0104170 [Sarcoptes scabiei]
MLDPKCADPFDNSSLPIKDCREMRPSHEGIQIQTATMCRKIRQKIHGNWRTIRNCAFLGSPGEGTGNENNCLYRKGTYDIYLEYCTCNSKDGCNDASRLVSNFQRYNLNILVSISFLWRYIVL